MAWSSSRKVLCWVWPASGPFLENSLFRLKVGLRWVCVNGLKWGSKVGEKVGFGQKWVKMAKTHHFTQLLMLWNLTPLRCQIPWNPCPFLLAGNYAEKPMLWVPI